MYTAIFLAFALAMLWASLKRPESLVALAICMFGIESFFQAKSTFFTAHSSFLNLCVLAMLLARCGLAFTKNEVSWPTRSTVWRTAIYLLAYAIFSGIWTLDQDQFFTNWKRGAPYILIYLVLVPCLVSSFTVAKNSLVWTMYMGAVTAALLYFTCDWELRGVALAGQSKFATGRDTSAILAVAQLGGTVAIIAALLTLKGDKITKMLRWAIVAIGLLVAIRTGSRGQTFAAFACIVLFTPVANRAISVRGVLITAFSLVIFGLMANYLFETYATHGRWNSTIKSLQGRQVMWEAMFKRWNHGGPMTWIFGLGNASSYKIVGFYIHNIPIEILCEEGLIGAALYLRLSFEAFRKFATGLQLSTRITSDHFRVITVFMAVFCYEVLGTLKSGSLYGHQLFILYAILLEVTVLGWQSLPQHNSAGVA